MLGHKMFQTLSRRVPETWCTIRGRRDDPAYAGIPHLKTASVLEEFDVMDLARLETRVAEHRFDVVVNCAGVVKQRSEATAAVPSITMNSLMPHRLAQAVAQWSGRVIHFSTDCVFSGRRGNYWEDDESDALDLYGRSKFLGEIAGENALTLRTSIIGRELHHHRSLLDWFLSQRGTIRGFARHWWSGVTSNHLCDLVGDIIERHPDLNGVYQVSSGRISKYDLLCKARQAYGLDIQIVRDEEQFLDRSLRGERLGARIGYVPPSWDAMFDQLLADPTEYPIGPESGAPRQVST